MRLVKVACSRNISPPVSHLEGERNEAWAFLIRKAFLVEAWQRHHIRVNLNRPGGTVYYRPWL